ncbi:HAD family hydrolase [Modestobacter sp. Leaf380]|uniref:HAD family hydrolase n=1 Tax=Modestobacter sp. Leaf380 TaxID=1736356 RepID=UPI0006F4E9D4|nr:HAD family hydrolase [Modestobacter sp. Leaf380]KQS71210.1 hypothetical protein ASG41_20985 [Modestobacter sp. Leaf380]
MPPPLYIQTTIAFIWDFDRTLIPGYMQNPLFETYGVDASLFWKEVNGLVDHYGDQGLMVSKDTAYLGHILSYVAAGKFPDLSNERLRDFGAQIELAPGMPDFMTRTRALVARDPYAHHGIKVEHYILSTGLRQMIYGTPFADVVEGVWGSELIPDPPPPGYLTHPPSDDARTGVVSQVGYTIDNTTKTRAIFEINKGVNHDPEIDVNGVLAPEERRVPFKNMIYVADGPSDVPVFSLVGKMGGKTFGVYTLGEHSNYEGVKTLSAQGRIMGMGETNYNEGSPSDLWLMSTLKELADEIVHDRERALASVPGVPGHVT